MWIEAGNGESGVWNCRSNYLRPILGLVLTALLVSCASPKPKTDQLIGNWICGPYSMKVKNLKITVVDRVKYDPSGKYNELSDVMIKTADGDQVAMKSTLVGSWRLDGKIIYEKFDRGEILSSDNPRYSVASGQKALDAELFKKNWAKKQVLELGKRLVVKPVESMYKEAEVVVSCVRPGS